MEAVSSATFPPPAGGDACTFSRRDASVPLRTRLARSRRRGATDQPAGTPALPFAAAQSASHSRTLSRRSAGVSPAERAGVPPAGGGKRGKNDARANRRKTRHKPRERWRPRRLVERRLAAARLRRACGSTIAGHARCLSFPRDRTRFIRQCGVCRGDVRWDRAGKRARTRRVGPSADCGGVQHHLRLCVDHQAAGHRHARAAGRGRGTDRAR